MSFDITKHIVHSIRELFKNAARKAIPLSHMDLLLKLQTEIDYPNIWPIEIVITHLSQGFSPHFTCSLGISKITLAFLANELRKIFFY